MRTAALALLCLSITALAGDTPREIVRKILLTTDAAERARLVDALVAAKPDPHEAAKWFAEGRTYSADVPKGWLDLTVKGSDGKVRPYLLYVPTDYTPEKKYPFLVDMHGGVARPGPPTHRELDQMKFLWGEHAEDEGCFLAIPSGETRAEWWTEVGSGNVLRILAEARRKYNIDENRVFATGFSDGGSGTFYLALTAPTLLAGAIPLNGHIAVAQAGGLQVHLRNLVNVPIYAINTENDQLYPPESVKPVIDALKELGANVTWREVAEYGHDPGYLPAEHAAIATWMWDRRRDPQPPRVLWEGTVPGRVRWLSVTAIGDRSGNLLPDLNPMLPPDHVRIGVSVDPAFEGPGVRVDVVDRGPALRIGIQPGDIIVGFDEATIDGLSELRKALATKAPGDSFRIRLRRGGKTVEADGKFPDAQPEAAFRRELPYGSIQADAKANTVDVLANGIRSFDLYLGEPLFDLSKPVVVIVNGETVFTGVVAPDLRFLAEEGAEDEDRTMLYLARLGVTVPVKGS